MRSLRILQIGKFFPPPFGGMETVLHNLIRVLTVDAEVDVVVANTLNRNESFKSDGAVVYKVHSFGAVAGTSICPTMPWVLWKLLRRRRYDIVHIHLPNPTGHMALQWILPKGTPLVITWHSDIIRQKNLMRFYFPILRGLLKRAEAIIAATPKNFSSSNQLDTAGYPEKLHAIPFGIDVDAYAETPAVMARARGIRSEFGEEIIFACGRHIYYKGFEYLIQAISKMRKGVLLLGGRGPMTSELEALAAKLGCSDRIHFLGFIPQDRIASYFFAATIVAMPSVDKSEAFGMVQLEAMACRKPVVCCELHNGVSYVNQNGITGLVVEPRDPIALAGALNRLLEDESLRARMGEAGYKRVLGEFSLEAMRRAHMSLFSDLAGTAKYRPDRATRAG